MTTAKRGEAVYGFPPPALVMASATAVQVSPLVPDGEPIEALSDGSLSRFVILAPPGTVERRYALAQGLRLLEPRGEMIALAPKTLGGSRLKGELVALNCAPHEDARRHHRICRMTRPDQPKGVEEALTAGAPRLVSTLGLWSQPGVFSWDRIDPGTTALLGFADGLKGRGADLGCGVGVLGREILKSDTVDELFCADIDRRAIAAARRNIDDRRARFLHHDIRLGLPELASLDFVVMNPPFHENGSEDRGLGLAFISAAANMLRKGGICRLVANAALPYENRLNAEFSSLKTLSRTHGYKVYEAMK